LRFRPFPRVRGGRNLKVGGVVEYSTPVIRPTANSVVGEEGEPVAPR